MRGHPIRGFFAGLLLGICLDLDLALGGVVETNSSTLAVVLVVSIVVCFLLGVWAPIGRYSRKSKTPPRVVAQPLPAPVAWPETAPTEGSNTPGRQTWKAPPPPPAGDTPPAPSPPNSPPPTPSI